MIEIPESLMEQYVALRRGVERILGVEPDSRPLPKLTDDLNRMADDLDAKRGRDGE